MAQPHGAAAGAAPGLLVAHSLASNCVWIGLFAARQVCVCNVIHVPFCPLMCWPSVGLRQSEGKGLCQCPPAQ
jgi:hypothetical protein